MALFQVFTICCERTHVVCVKPLRSFLVSKQVTSLNSSGIKSLLKGLFFCWMKIDLQTY